MTTCQMCDRPMEDGYLCLGCTKSTWVRLECIPDLHDGLALVLPPGRSGGGRAAKGGPPPLPLREDVLDLRVEMLDVLESWVRAVRTDRRRTARVAGVNRVRCASGELLEHLPWVVVSWPEAGTLAGEVRDLADAALSVLGPPAAAVRGTRIGRCPAEFDDGSVCGSVLRLMPGEQVVTCSWCGTTYPPAMWAGLKMLMDADAKERAGTGS